MVDLARRQNRLLMETFQFRFHAQHAVVKEILASGLIGDIRCFRSAFGFPPFPDGKANIRYQKALGGGALLDAGAYTIKAATFMLGEGRGETEDGGREEVAVGSGSEQTVNSGQSAVGNEKSAEGSPHDSPLPTHHSPLPTPHSRPNTLHPSPGPFPFFLGFLFSC